MLDLSEAFEKAEDEYIKFERVENPLHPRPDICAFLLLDKLLPGSGDIVACAEHDEIFLDIDCEKLAEAASEDDIITLSRCGVRFDSDLDSLAMYV